MAPPLLDETSMRLNVSRLLVLAACLGCVACGGVEEVDDLIDGSGGEEWVDTVADEEPLSIVPREGGGGLPEDGRGRTSIAGIAPQGTAGGSSPDPIPARHTVSAPIEDRRFEFQFPECEPFPAGLWRDACNRSLGGRGR